MRSRYCLLLSLHNAVFIPGQAHQTLGMPPIFAATSLSNSSHPKTLEHGALFLCGIIDLTTRAKPPSVVVVVLVLCPCTLSSHAALCASGFVCPKSAWRGRWQPCCSAIANKVPFRKELDQCVLAVTRDAARVAYSGWGIAIAFGVWGWIAGQAREH